ncbi:MAG: hypothetical protein WD229_13070 [Pirellulales bacterium]
MNPQSGSPQIGGKAGRIQYVGPDTYILLDADGRPQPVPGMTYEDFMAAWKQAQQPAEGRNQPRYRIENIDIEGTARDGHATLRFTARVHLLTDDPVEVPLGLLGAILQGEPAFAPPDEEATDAADDDEGDSGRNTSRRAYLYLNPERGGFVAHLEGRTGQRRDISLDLLVPLTRDGGETTLPLNCARGLSSNLTLELDKPVADANVNSGTLLATEPTPAGGSRLKIAGAMGSIRLTWHTGNPTAAEVATVLGAEGAIRVSIDGRSVRSDARLTVQSYGGSFDRFRVRLPPGAQLVHDEPASGDAHRPAYRVTVEDPSPAAADGAGGGQSGQVVLVQLPEKQQSPAIIELSTEQPIGLEDGGPLVELGGFEVLGAVRQFGDVAVELAGDWQARWDLADFVRQVDPSELDVSLQQAGVTAAFQYDRQPWSLGMRVTARQFRVHVTPQYVLEVLPDEALLTVRLAYQVFGSRAFEFHVGLEGWEMREDPIDSGGLVDHDRIQVTPDGTLVLPLAQGSSRRAVISFSVRRALPRDLERLRMPLPIPLADSVGTGELLVSGAPEVELQPDLAASIGLTPTPVSESADEANGAEGAQHRFRTSLPEAVFVSERLSRTRDVTVVAAAQIEINPTEAQVDQRFDYAVRYEPIKELHFEIAPEVSFDPEQTEIKLIASAGSNDPETERRETPLSFVSSEIETEALPSGAHRLRAALPQPRLGQFAVRIRYHVWQPASELSSTAWQLPLFQTTEGRVTATTATIRTPQTLSVALDTSAEGSSWQPAEAQATATGTVQQYLADRSEPSLPLVVRAVDPNLPSSTIVERVWLQSWLSGDTRQDRAAFRFRTTASQTTIELPPQVQPDEVEVLVDSRLADVVSRGTGRIQVRAPQTPSENGKTAEQDGELHTLELRYRQPVRRGLIRRHRLTPPQIVGTTALSALYWQIVLPGDQHIVRSPVPMTSASEWQWLGSFWGFRPVMSQGDLEDWSGASAQLSPAAADNKYLFTGLAPVATIEVITAPRWLIVLAASAAVLLMVLVWVYVPQARRAWIVVGLTLVITGLAIAFPLPALLLAQASAVGVVVAAISVFIARIAARPARPTVAGPIALSSGSSQRQLTPRADSILMPPVTAGASTAPTASLGIPEPDR